jgi:hypothetical protein
VHSPKHNRLSKWQRESGVSDTPSRLGTPEKLVQALNTEYLLGVRALRLQEENKVEEGSIENDRRRFELARNKTYLALEVVVALALLTIALILAVDGHGALSLVPLGGGVGFGGLAALLHQSPKPSSE